MRTSELHDALSPAEQRIWDAFPRGEHVVLEPDGEILPPVRAAVLRTLLLGAREAEPGHLAGLWVSGANITGQLDLTHAEIGSLIRLLGCTFAEPPELAWARLRTVELEGSTMPGIQAFSATVDGSLNLVSCTVTGPAWLSGMHLSGDLDFDWATMRDVTGGAVTVGRHLYLQGTTITGVVELTGARIRGSVYGRQGLRVDGELRLIDVEVGGIVDLTGARLDNPGGTAVTCWALRARELSLRPALVGGAADLRYSRLGVLRDDPALWPAELMLDGAEYLALRPLLTARERLPWLARDVDGYRPQPYEQLATLYRQIGHEADARTVLLAKQRGRRRQLPLLNRGWGVLQDALLAYGYQPGRAAVWLLLLVAAGTVAFQLDPPRPAPGGPAVSFNAVVYSLDLLVPIADLGQEHAFVTSGAQQWLAYAFTATGWILFTAVAAALTRSISRS